MSLRFVGETETGRWYSAVDESGDPIGYVQVPHLRPFTHTPPAPDLTDEQRLAIARAYVLAHYATRRPS